MALISFTPADVLRNRVLEVAWYTWEIIKIEGPTANNAKDGYNFKVTFKLVKSGNPDLDGKEVERIYSNKAISMMLPLVAAAKGLTLSEMKPEAFQLDTEELLGKHVDGKAELEVYMGNTKNVLNEFLPAGKGTAGPSW